MAIEATLYAQDPTKPPEADLAIIGKLDLWAVQLLSPAIKEALMAACTELARARNYKPPYEVRAMVVTESIGPVWNSMEDPS